MLNILAAVASGDPKIYVGATACSFRFDALMTVYGTSRPFVSVERPRSERAVRVGPFLTQSGPLGQSAWRP